MPSALQCGRAGSRRWLLLLSRLHRPETDGISHSQPPSALGGKAGQAGSAPGSGPWPRLRAGSPLVAAKPKAITNAPSQHPNTIRKLRYIRIQVYLHCVGCGLAGAQAHHSRRRAAAGIEEEVAVYFRTTRSNLLEIVLIRS